MDSAAVWLSRCTKPTDACLEVNQQRPLPPMFAAPEIFVWEAVAQGGLGTEVPQWSPETKPRYRISWTSSPRSWNSLQILFADLGCRNDQNLKISHNSLCDSWPVCFTLGAKRHFGGLAHNPCLALHSTIVPVALNACDYHTVMQPFKVVCESNANTLQETVSGSFELQPAQP